MAGYVRQNSTTSAKTNASFIEYSVSGPIQDLRNSVFNNIGYYRKTRSYWSERFLTVFCMIEQETDALNPAAEGLERVAPLFDYDRKSPGNGYRSLVNVVGSCVSKLTSLCHYVQDHRNSYLFRAGHYIREIEAYANALGQLRVILGYAQKLLAYSEEGSLFPTDEQFPHDVMLEMQALDRECFFGRCLGFQFCESLYQPLNQMSLAVAAFGDGYQRQEGAFSRVASSLFHGGRYSTNPDVRGKQVVDIFNTSDVRVCKAFWAISEGDNLAEMCNFMAGSVAINKLIQITPHNFEMERVDSADETATITPPCAHVGPGPVQIRLLSFVEREGQAWVQDGDDHPEDRKGNVPPRKPPSPMSKGLLIHIHGGGFIGHTSKSHEVYLRSWAKDLGVPIVSIDYSLSPELPFPRAFEECFFAYAWAVKNAPYLGSTGEHICIAGDGAGGNLATAVAMRAASYGIQAPDGLVTTYAPFLVHHSLSPSRLMCLFDPMLPLGVHLRSVAAYSGVKEEDLSLDSVISLVQRANEKMSPRRAPSFSSLSTTSKDSDDEVERKKPRTASASSTPNLDKINEIPTATRELDSPTESQGDGTPEEDRRIDNLSDSVERASLEERIEDVSKVSAKDQNKSETNGNDNKENSKKSAPIQLPTGERVAVFDPSQPPVIPSLKTNGYGDHVLQESSLNNNMTMVAKSGETIEPSGNLNRNNLQLDLKDKSKNAHFEDDGPTPAPFVTSPVKKFREIPIMRNPYISPYVASDELLEGLPPMHIIACSLDPLLDDSIMFAKKLHRLNKHVQLDVIDRLPHGFLNFSPISTECKAASMRCVRHIMQVLYGFQGEELFDSEDDH
ncbi:Hormone-sensitive lipase [Holothuria leucospilota]|uniref:Hormone-sensitive lipase n=1 Tax=Holothuria leucospilota TaxID=206669 RepID=A0A9Q1H7F4_HOLLE|nr:Hormone-sensitive lipase [Holothuria leucospilota]